MSVHARRIIEDTQDNKMDKSSMSNDFPMTAGRTNKVVTESVALQGDLATRRKIWVDGIIKNDAFPYASKVQTSGGNAVANLTDDGTASGNAVFSNVYTSSVLIVPYGTANNLQPGARTLSGDNKTLTIEVRQSLLSIGILSLTTVANGLDCVIIVWGD